MIFDIREVVGSAIPAIKIVDVGAMVIADVTAIYAPLVKTKLAIIVGFEPVKEECAKAQAFLGSDHLCLPYAIGDGSQRTFHICNYPMNSSLYEPNLPLLEQFQSLENLMKVVRREQVQTHRLDDLNEVKDTDYLKLDVQGAELDVINGAERLLAEVVAVQVEVEYIPMYKDQPLFAEVDQALRRNGFLMHRFLDFGGRVFKPLVFDNNINHRGSQEMWSDAVYVKDFMRLDRLSPEKLLKLAVILHMVFSSIDLPTFVLKAYDARMQTAYAPAYMQRLARRKLNGFITLPEFKRTCNE